MADRKREEALTRNEQRIVKASIYASSVTWLTLPDVAGQWAEENDERADILEKALYEYWNRLRSEGIDFDCPEWRLVSEYRFELGILADESAPLPDASLIEVNRAFVKRFCFDNKHTPPIFWFGGKQQHGPRFPGKPSIMPTIIRRLRHQAEAGELKKTLAAQARELAAWANKAISGFPIPTAKAIENGIRKEYWALQKTPRN